ncbi:hypothetical protein SLEP1_g59938 [Rubroshorea leprosula]|uniref:Uncharacterized protein n=1 Tax=Rubroshorea leprosula TaxID=152421 RepID=A0AAV5MUA9_9ROSI|nr:hypothetical protein SLEP1_g59938 [Rubroshorea leprosula]
MCIIQILTQNKHQPQTTRRFYHIRVVSWGQWFPGTPFWDSPGDQTARNPLMLSDKVYTLIQSRKTKKRSTGISPETLPGIAFSDLSLSCHPLFFLFLLSDCALSLPKIS